MWANWRGKAQRGFAGVVACWAETIASSEGTDTIPPTASERQGTHRTSRENDRSSWHEGLTKNLAVHHDLPRVNREVRVVERPIELLRCLRLVRRVVVGRDVLVPERVCRSDPLARVEHEHLLQQVDRYARHDQSVWSRGEG